MSHWITRHLSSLLMSFLLAFFFWAIATEAEDPTQVRTFPNPIPVEIRGLREDLTAQGAQNIRVRVEVRAPRSVWETLRAEDIHAYVNLTEVPTGTVEVPVQVDIDVEPTDVTNVTPGEIELSIEPIAEREMPVTLSIQGTVALGFTTRPAEMVPQTVRLRGPEEQVERVSQVIVEVVVEGRQHELRGNYYPTPVDEMGAEVPHVEILPEAISVRVPIEQWLNTRDLPVKPNLIGQPAPGYGVANIEIDPQTITVFGPAEALASNQTIQTDPISLEGITETLQITVPLRVPPGLSILSGQPTVAVALTIDAVRSSLNLEITPTLQGLRPELTATVGLDAIVVILSGPLSAMETLDPAEVRATIDLQGYPVGEYSINPQVSVPSNVEIDRILPEEVPVTVMLRTEIEEAQP